MIVLVSRMQIKPGFQEDIKALAKVAIDATLKEKGCISYRFLQDSFDDCTFCFVEEWLDQESLRAHTLTEHFLKWREQNAHMVADRAIKIYEAQESSFKL